jgi:two-component system, OmpR family, response regulator
MSQTVPATEPRSASQRGPSVLLVEPEPMLRLTMTKFLQRSGYRVSTCSDAAAAEALIANGAIQPALIVLGVRVLDRDAAADARRLQEAVPGTPMLGVADAIGELGDAGALPNNLRFLAHPFDMPDVLRAVRSSLRQSGAEAAVGS